MWYGTALLNNFVVLAFLVVFVVFMVWWAKSMFRRGNSRPEATGKTPLEIAKERYARGEISKEEFEQLKKDLS
jgi:putative membrane protein